jgi:hypothetical protein
MGLERREADTQAYQLPRPDRWPRTQVVKASAVLGGNGHGSLIVRWRMDRQTTLEHYRQKALELERNAAEAKSAESRDYYLRLAKEWRMLAQSGERNFGDDDGTDDA